jgi:hypothetical protein
MSAARRRSEIVGVLPNLVLSWLGFRGEEDERALSPGASVEAGRSTLAAMVASRPTTPPRPRAPRDLC